MLTLIDADILVYESAYRCQKGIEWIPGEFTYTASLPEAQEDLETSVEYITEACEATEIVMVLTDGDRDANFRRSVWPDYKQNREGVSTGRPLLYAALREWIHETYRSHEEKGIEGDDSLGIMLTMAPDPSQVVVASVDKDMHTIPGRHYNWRKEEEGVVTVDAFNAFYFFMYQTLVGDSVDGYPGLKGCGPKGAAKILDPLLEIEYDSLNAFKYTLWVAVVQAYEKKGAEEEDALVQARCARILRAQDWDFATRSPILWTIDRELEAGDVHK